MLPVLRAQESLAQIDRLVYAQGGFKDQDASSYIDALRQVSQRQSQKERVATRPQSVDEMLKMMGGHSVEAQLVRGPEFERMERERIAAEEAAAAV